MMNRVVCILQVLGQEEVLAHGQGECLSGMDITTALPLAFAASLEDLLERLAQEESVIITTEGDETDGEQEGSEPDECA